MRPLFRTIFLFIIILACSVSGSQAQWQQTAGPFGGDVKSVINVGDTLLAATNSGLYRSLDGGAVWNLMALRGKQVRHLFGRPGSAFALYSWFENGDSLYGVARSTDGWENWEESSAGLVEFNAEIRPTMMGYQGHSLVWLFAYNGDDEKGMAYTSEDLGASWQPRSDLPGTDPVIATLWYGDVLLASAKGAIWRKDAPAAPWRMVQSSNDELSLARFGTLLMTGGGSRMYRSTDGGNNWLAIPYTGTSMDRLVMLGDTLLGLPAGFSNSIHYSLDSGTTWTPYYSPREVIRGMIVVGDRLLCYDPAGVFALYSGAENERRSDSGIIASRIGSVRYIDGSIYASTPGGRLFRSTDGGGAWRTFADNVLHERPVTLHVGHIGGSIFVGGRGLSRSADSGLTWQVVEEDSSIIHGITQGGPVSFVWGALSGVRISKDSGATWSPVPAIRRLVNAVYAASPTVIVVADRMIYRSGDDGETWDSTLTTFQGAVLQKYLVGLRRGALLLSNYRELLRSGDNGLTWSKVALPVPITAAYHLAAYGDKAVVVTDRGFFQSDGDGLAWTPMETGEMGDARSVALGAGIVFAGSTEQGVWKQPIVTSGVAAPGSPRLTAISLLRVTPNPAYGAALAEFSVGRAGNVTVEIFDLFGRRVRSFPAGWLQPGEHRLPFDCGVLSSGAYHLRLAGPDGVSDLPLAIVR